MVIAEGLDENDLSFKWLIACYNLLEAEDKKFMADMKATLRDTITLFEAFEAETINLKSIIRSIMSLRGRRPKQSPLGHLETASLTLAVT